MNPYLIKLALIAVAGKRWQRQCGQRLGWPHDECAKDVKDQSHGSSQGERRGRVMWGKSIFVLTSATLVQALAWCPWNSSLLASGGGTSDKTIHFWNTTTSARLNSLITPSQVTSLVWSPHSKEIMSSHGIPDHQLSIWSYPSLSKVTDIPNAHETRILHSCLSPDGTTVATASSDENLKFWKVFDVRKGAGGAGASGRGPIGAKDVDADHGIQKRSKTGMSVR